MQHLKSPPAFLILAVLLISVLSTGCALTAPGAPLSFLQPTQTATLAPSPTFTVTPSATPAATSTPTATPTASPSPTPTPVILAGAGDISEMGEDGDDQTAALLQEIGGTIFTAGDNTQDDGMPFEYNRYFNESWGQFKDRIRPSPGNHDYSSGDAQAYFDYFGAAAGEPGLGYYSYDLGSWHILSLNSNCEYVACGTESPQAEWLRADLAAHPSACSLAYFHHPRWSSGLAGSNGVMSPIVRVLYEYGVDVMISGHDHDYERFAPMDPEDNADPAHGIRQFVVGTGGAVNRPFLPFFLPNSQVHNTGTLGVLKLSLYPDRYDWQFVPVAGETFTDSGSTACH